jgi:hypothetical protein
MTRGQFALLIFLLAFIVLILLIVLFTVPTCHTWVTQTSEKYLGKVKSLNVKSFDATPSPVFPTPTSLTLANALQFGQYVFVHDQGFVCVSATLPGLLLTTLIFYQVTNTTVDKLATEIQVPHTLLTGEPAVLCNGTFVSSLGVLDEVLYLIIVMGVTDTNNNKFGRELHVYYFDTDESHPNDQVWTKSNTILTHPYFSERPDFTPVYVGCFGNSLQSLVDQNITGGSRQSLYVSGTEFAPLNASRPQPSAGGLVFQYLFLSNTINPVISLQYTIQDAKLLVISDDLTTPVPSPLMSEQDYYMRGFGSVFAVSSSGFLAVANLTNQDTINNPCDASANANAPNGYVQVFSLVGGIWTQSFIICHETESLNKQIYVNRITPPAVLGGSIGFGAGLLIVDNFLFVNASNNITTVYNLFTNNYPSPPNLVPWSTVNVAELSSVTTFPGPIFNRNLLLVDGNLVVVSYDTAASKDVIAIYQTNNTSSVTVSALPTLFMSFPLLQTIGAATSSGSSTQSLVGFGQFTQSCKSPNQIRTLLFINDPLGKRVWIYES